MKKSLTAAVVALAASVVLADGESELDVAREALRDGLWEVARAHAAKAGGEDGRLVVLESFAREGRWPEVLKSLDEWDEPAGEGFLCYKAAALFHTGDVAAADGIVSKKEFSLPQFVRASSRIKAKIALAKGDAKGALGALSKSDDGDVEMEMLKADALAANGDTVGAKAIWRKAFAAADSSESIKVDAAAKLGDVAVLRKAYQVVVSPELRRLCGFHLGVSLLKDGKTFDEGAKTISKLVKDSPDADGAKDVFLALADARLDRGEWSAANQIYTEAVETWPDIVKDASFQEGRGWALFKLGRDEEALLAFDRAAELSTNRSEKAAALVKAGDALVALGRGAEAIERYRTVRRDYSDTEAAAKLADILRIQELEDEGRELYSQYRFADAQKVFERIAQEDLSRRSRMTYYIVLCLYGQGRDEEAEKKARSLVEDETVPPDTKGAAMLWLAKLAYNKSKWKESAALFSDYAELLPKSQDAAAALVWSARASFAASDYQKAIATVGTLVANYPESEANAAGLIVQGETLIELARFDEAVLILERASLSPGCTSSDRLRSQILRADALFAMGADNSERYLAALEAYRTILLGENLTPAQRLSLSFKIGKTFERLKRMDEAIDQYYTQVVLAYRDGRKKGLKYDDVARADFARAAFRLAEECESRGRDDQAVSVLKLVAKSDVPAAAEASRRINSIKSKGKFL